jgi:hypothetical protein
LKNSPAKAYSDTAVSAERSMGEAMELLRRREATALQWTEEGSKSTLRFRWRTADKTELCDGGLLTVEQALLPYLEDATGQTIGELLAPRLHQLAAAPLHRAIGGGN